MVKKVITGNIKRVVIITVLLYALVSLAEDIMLLKMGTKAPDFTLENHLGDSVTLSKYKDNNYVVLVFYPADESPVCTKQLCELRDSYSELEKFEAVVFGINPAGKKSHGSFAEKNGFQYPLLTDSDNKVIKSYGCKGLVMTKRTVYVIDKQGNIIYSKRGKPPVSEIVESIVSDQKK